MSVYITFKDLPPWAQTICKARDMRPASIEVRVGAEHEIPPTWHDNDRRDLHAFTGEDVTTKAGAYYESLLNASPQEKAVWSGGKLRLLNANHMVLETHTYPKIARLYVHPEAMPAMLPASPELSWEERVVLTATAGLKSSYDGVSDYRRHEAMKLTGISSLLFDQARASCIGKGLLSKSKAITAKGRTALGDRYSSLYSLKDERPQ